MSNPFPGMNPYLELAAWWPSIHTRLITYLADALDRDMPPGYIASIEERCRVVQTGRSIFPDVYLWRERPSSPSTSEGGTAVAVRSTTDIGKIADAALIVEQQPIEPREPYIDIVDTRQNGRIVTTVEILSPVNKTSGEGQELYLTKQREVLNSRTHLLEIDLLRAGQPTVAVGRPFLPDVPRYEYLICLHRAGQGRRFGVWPCSIRERLPRITIPLSENDQDVVVDLQPILNQCYERGRFAQQINYAQPPDPPLDNENAAWADTLLQEQNLRP